MSTAFYGYYQQQQHPAAHAQSQQLSPRYNNMAPPTSPRSHAPPATSQSQSISQSHSQPHSIQNTDAQRSMSDSMAYTPQTNYAPMTTSASFSTSPPKSAYVSKALPPKQRQPFKLNTSAFPSLTFTPQLHSKDRALASSLSPPSSVQPQQTNQQPQTIYQYYNQSQSPPQSTQPLHHQGSQPPPHHATTIHHQHSQHPQHPPHSQHSQHSQHSHHAASHHLQHPLPYGNQYAHHQHSQHPHTPSPQPTHAIPIPVNNNNVNNVNYHNSQQTTPSTSPRGTSPTGRSLVRSNTTDLEALELLEKEGLVRIEIPADGSCMFRALADQLLLSQVQHQTLRKQCVEFIKLEQEHFKNYLQIVGVVTEEYSFEDYCAEMLLPTTWGGEVELHAISQLYQVNIKVFSSQGCTKIDNGFVKDVSLWFSHGNHYDICIPHARMKAMAASQTIVYDLFEMLFGNGDINTRTEYHNVHHTNWLISVSKQERRDSNLAMQIEQSEAKKIEEEHKINEMAALQVQHQLHQETDSEMLARRLQDEEFANQQHQQMMYQQQLQYQQYYGYHSSASKDSKSKKDKSKDKEEKKQKKGFKKFVGFFKPPPMMIPPIIIPEKH